MKIARILQNNAETYGLIMGSKIATKDDMTYQTGVPLPHSIKDFFYDGWYDQIKDSLKGLACSVNVSECKMLAPIANPGKIICMAFNYTDHAREQKRSPPDEPVLSIKPKTALNSHGSDIVCPDFVTQLDYEIELAVVIGQCCKDVTEKQASNAIFGYMVFNDVSARDIQFGDGQFTRGKGFDTFAPCGPWLTTADEVGDPHNLTLLTKVNGELRQDSSTSNMSMKIPEIISKISKVMTLERGDIISTGTPAGVALNNPDAAFLKDGDVVEMQIERLGVLTNTVRIVKSSQGRHLRMSGHLLS